MAGCKEQVLKTINSQGAETTVFSYHTESHHTVEIIPLLRKQRHNSCSRFYPIHWENTIPKTIPIVKELKTVTLNSSRPQKWNIVHNRTDSRFFFG